MQVSVIGAGYVGLVTAACLAHIGNTVRVLEIDRERVARLERGELPIHEAGLDDLVSAGLTSGRLSFHADISSTYASRLVIVAVGTLDAQGEWTAATVRHVVLTLASDPAAPRAIAIRSSLMPGTAADIAAEARSIDPAMEVALNPEFMREASAVRDFLEPDRVVIGVPDPSRGRGVEADLRELYAPLGSPIQLTDLTSAEMIKIASNVFLAAKITFANELARVCAAVGADVTTVVDGMGLDRRIGRSFLSPGPGYGGSCFPSQARALPLLAFQQGIHVPLISAVAPSNEYQADWVLDQVADAMGDLAGSRVALLGLTFKAGTDDLRESPALLMARRLVQRGARLTVFDPIATASAAARLAEDGVLVEACRSVEEASEGADAVIVATEWPEFGSIDWVSIASRMAGRVVADVRHVVDVDRANEAGLDVIVHGKRVRSLAGAL